MMLSEEVVEEEEADTMVNINIDRYIDEKKDMFRSFLFLPVVG